MACRAGKGGERARRGGPPRGCVDPPPSCPRRRRCRPSPSCLGLGGGVGARARGAPSTACTRSLTIVKAARPVVLLPTHHRVDGLRLVADGHARGVVDVIPEPLVEIHPVHTHAIADDDLVLRRVDQLVALVEVVALRRLVEDVRDDAVERRAEGLVRRHVRKAARREHADVGRAPVGRARDVVQRPRVGGVERARGGVRGDADVARRAEDIAGARGGGGARAGGGDDGREPVHGGREGAHGERWGGEGVCGVTALWGGSSGAPLLRVAYCSVV